MLASNRFLCLCICFMLFPVVGLFTPMSIDQLHVIIIMFLIALYEPLCVVLWRCELDQTTKDLFNVPA